MGRGVSLEEKRDRLLEFFYETRDFFMLKEIEKIVPKRKGIVAQCVKEVLQGLVDDDFVRQEKIGASNFFWSFPSQKVVQRGAAAERLRGECERLRERVATLRRKVAEEEALRAGADRRSLIADYKHLSEAGSRLGDALRKRGGCCSEKFEEKKAQAERLREETNKVTDDIFSIQSYVRERFGIEAQEFCRTFGIEEAMDYLQ